MNTTAQPATIQTCDYWFKIVEFLQQNWALIDQTASGALIGVVGDTSRVVDQIETNSVADAEGALRRTGFRRFADEDVSSFLSPPQPPFSPQPHPNGPIYSSGRF